VSDIERAPARDPQELERFLVARQQAGDIEGMVALFEPDAVIQTDDGRVLRGHDQMRSYYREIAAAGRVFAVGEQQPALVNGDLALTSTRSQGGGVTAEVARRQPDGRWLWVIDQYEIAQRVTTPGGSGVVVPRRAE
jgi:ketosteroid isomerase-like protein